MFNSQYMSYIYISFNLIFTIIYQLLSLTIIVVQLNFQSINTDEKGLLQSDTRYIFYIVGVFSPSKARRHLFVPAERSVPRIRIETRQASAFEGCRIVVAIDSWPRNSRYPQVSSHILH